MLNNPNIDLTVEEKNVAYIFEKVYEKKRNFNGFNSASYILKEEQAHLILNINKLAKFLQIAKTFVEQEAAKGGKFLFTTTNIELVPIVREYAIASDNFYSTYRWLGGTFTNWHVMQKKLADFKLLEKQEEETKFKNLSPVIRNKTYRELKRLRNIFEGMRNMVEFPAGVILLNPNISTIRECNLTGIPVVCILNMENNIKSIPYPIITLDSSKNTFNLILQELNKSILLGKISSLKK